MMTTRHRDWQARLQAVLDAHRQQPFAWGRHDCVRFAAACVHAVTAQTPALPDYAGARAAMRALHAHGGLRAAVTGALGEPIAPALAAAGDIGLLVAGDRESLAVNVGGGSWLAPTAEGLREVRAELIQSAWRCDRA